MILFEPVADQARWRLIYDLLLMSPVDSVITYGRMAELLHLDPVLDRPKIQAATRRAASEFEEVEKHAIKAVPNVGYRVVLATEHLALAQDHQRRAGKSLVRGHSKVVNVDLSQVTPEIRSAFQVVAQAFSMQMEMSRRLDARQSNLEETMRSITQRQQHSDDEVAELRARLAKIEQAASTPASKA